jgi:hypothetical protein
MGHRARILTQVLLPYLYLVGVTHAAPQKADLPDEVQPTIVLGVLEDHPGRHPGEANFRSVRAVFQKNGNEWQAFPSVCQNWECLKTVPKKYPKEVNWTIAFDGRNLGLVTARTPQQFHAYDEVGFEEITSAGPIPTIGKRSTDYTGFPGAPAYRPLVAVSQSHFKDPEIWKPSRPSSGLITALRLQFRRKFPKVSNCRDPNEGIQRPWQYQDEDIKIGKAYSSKNNWSLAELYLTGWRCDGPEEDGGAFDGQWYVIEPAGEPRFLGTGMWLVDAGDYDNDGKSEVLFSIAGYNRGGYRLFYDDFKESAEFLFGYY